MSNKIDKYAKTKWLEIKYLYRERSLLELDSYSVSKELTNHLSEANFQEWIIFQKHMLVMMNAKFKNKMSTLKKESKNLTNNNSDVQLSEPTGVKKNQPPIRKKHY